VVSRHDRRILLPDSTSRKTVGMGSPWVLDEDDALDLFAFLVTAARTQVDEAREYGPLRLLSAAHRLAEAALPQCSHETAAMLTQALPHIPLLAVPREGSDEYVDQLDGLCAAVARYLVARYAEVEQP
jgi:hypothetical protein